MPHLTAKIVSLSQDMDLASGSMANFMLLQLADGTTLRALINDDAAQDIVRLSIGQNGFTHAAPPTGIEETLIAPEMSTHVFGGAEPTGVPAAEPEELPPPKPPPRRPKRVDKDDMGYPIVHMEGSADPRDGVGGRDRDEDGVGQI